MQNANKSNMLPMSEINVTPLVDVMLVLLIIFMLTAPHLAAEQGVEVELPQVTVTPLPARSDEMIITVTRDKKVYLDEVAVSLDRLEPVLREALRGRSEKDVYLRADRDVPYGFVVRVMAAAKKAGAPGLGMVTEPEEIENP